MIDNKEKVLVLDVNCKDIFKVHSKDKTIVQILFDGKASGEYFNGSVLPGGVDTQKGNNADETGTLSARYILEGVDKSGKSCRMYIENESVFGSDVTFPSIVTDSKELEWLNSASLSGQIVNDEKGLHIIIYASK